MPSHSQTEVLPYSARQVYDLVADVAKYPEFLPWCGAARIVEKTARGFRAELVIRYRGLSHSYVSDVKLTPPDEKGAARIEATMLRGPFHHLENRWVFAPEGEKTRLDFFVDFRFKAPLLETLLGGFFDRAARRMVEAFRRRADALYGTRDP